jgi:putative LysE/RhtB family amino acid efflux pump
MSILLLFLKASFIGFAIAAIVGPIGLLFIRKTLEFGVAGAVSVGFGISVADFICGLVAALGLSVISNFLIEQESFLKIIGGLFLLYLAYKDIKSDLAKSEIKVKSKNIYKLGVEIFFLTLINPMTIASFISVFAAINTGSTTVARSLIMAGGVFVGSLIWWIILGALTLKIKHKLPENRINNIKYLSAFVLGVFGFIAIGSAFI